MRYTPVMALTPSSRMGADAIVASIAVLPFVHHGGGGDDEYLSDGLADELSNVLAKVKGMRVCARASSFQFRRRDVRPAEVGRALNVATLLNGSVSRTGDQLSVSVRLVNVADGRDTWSKTYECTLDGVFGVLGEIAQSVVAEVFATGVVEDATPDARAGLQAEVANALKGRGTNVEARRFYLRGRVFVESPDREDTARAIEHLEHALELEPEFALAWAHLGEAYYRQAGYGWAPLEDARRRAREARERALAIEPDLFDGHLSVAAALHYDERDHAGAESLLRKLLERAPGNARALRLSGVIAMHAGRLEEAITLYHRALERDPLSSRTHHSLAWSLHSLGRHVEAVSAYRKALALVPQMTGTRALLSIVLLDLGRAGEARAEAAAEPNEAMRLYAVACIEWTLGQVAEADAALDRLIERFADDAPSQIAGVYATRGELDQAFQWLERAQAIRDPGLLELRNFPNFRSVRSDPRWGAFLRKTGL